MYDYITGTVVFINAKSITVENNSIGYLIKTPNPYNFEVGSVYTVYTYFHIREDIHDLFGFYTKDERDFFLSLISVKGLGPKGALAIIASGNIQETIQAIDSSNNKYLEKFPGIGSKASQQIILDLNGKLKFNSQNDQKEQNPKLDNVKEALKNLGYKGSEIKKVESVIEQNIESPIGELIKIALKALL